jgi:hypothetical protein
VWGVCVYEYVYICVPACVNVPLCVYECVCVHVCVFLYMCLYTKEIIAENKD